ncbi:MAG: hypothetical protein U9Q12_01100, partial [Patescibacteria group bacterium]|nr:hypothetical protein [Patescibacteria group bacterium]
LFSIIFMTVSIIGITMYHSILNADLYKEALDKSEIYTIVVDIVERNISESLVAWEKNLLDELIPGDAFGDNKFISGALSFVLNTVVEQQTPELVSSVFEKIGLAEVFQNVVEKAIDRDIAWLKGEHQAHEMFSYIPTPEQIESLKGGTFTQLLDGVVKNAVGINELAQCTSDSEVNANIVRINEGNVKNITCTSPQIDKLLDEEFANSKINTVINKVGGGADTIAQDSQVNALLTDIYDFSLTIANIKQGMLDMRAAVQSILTASYVVLGLSIIAGGFAIFLQKREKRFRESVIIVSSTGLVIIAVTGLYYLIFSRILANAIPLNEVTFSTNALTSAEGALLANSLRFILDYIITGIIALTFKMGIWISLLGLVMYAGLRSYRHRSAIKKQFDRIYKK